MYQQVVPRSKPIFAGQALGALSIGKAVKAGSVSGSFTAVSADTDIWIGVSTADCETGTLNATVALRGGGQVITAKLGTGCNFGQALYVTGSDGSFVESSSISAGPTTISQSNASAIKITGDTQTVAGWALAKGTAGDLIDVVLA